MTAENTPPAALPAAANSPAGTLPARRGFSNTNATTQVASAGGGLSSSLPVPAQEIEDDGEITLYWSPPLRRVTP